MEGGPKPDGLVASRVSTSRHGAIGTKLKPEVDCDTKILPLVPLTPGDNKSKAVSEAEPGVTNDAESVAAPLLSVVSPGKGAAGAVLGKCTGSLYVVTALLLESRAVT